MPKAMHRNSLNETNMTNKFFTQPAWTLAGPCFDLVLN